MISTKEIGDFKTPNRYWVSISEDYYIQNKDCLDWISGTLKGLTEPKGKTIKVFPSYKMARGWIDNNLYLGMDYDGIKVNCITVEDRLSGQVYEYIKAFYPSTAKVEEDQFTDTRFTEEEMAKRGLKFN